MNNFKKITIIIPFANEGCEVENTLKSIFEYSEDNVDIIIINDASDDGFDYKSITSKYDILYVENKHRLGVAASRELGVSLCKTDYFLLLDAHMRFYDNKWIERFTKELDKDSRTLLCAQTRVLKKKENALSIEEMSHSYRYSGAFINYFFLFNFIEPEWIIEKSKISLKKSTILIPCVLGAAYACSKKYWQYLNGLEGLMSYGNDEVLISLKVWMEGGTCKLLNDVVIGHIYRESPPYQHFSENRTYNRLYISYILLPTSLRKKTFVIEKTKYSETYFQSCILFYKNYEYIRGMKHGLKSKFTRNFFYFDKLNRSKVIQGRETLKYKNQTILDRISYIVRNIDHLQGIGLIDGKIGIIILLFHYAKFSSNSFFSKLAKSLLNEVISNVSENIPLNLAYGLLGIGWGIKYLYLNKFISGDVNKILSDLDMKVMEISPARMNNCDLFYGFGGVVRYMLCRLYSGNQIEERDNPFSKEFLLEVYNKAKDIIENVKYNTCPESYIEFILYYENRKEIDPPSIYDITVLPGWNEFSRINKKLSWNGITGFCLEFILSQSVNYNF